jgi:AcrR family transcriptional regulator
MPGPRAPKQARREQILSAAYAVALRTGIDGVTLRAVAAQAKLSHGLVVFYFKGKDQLIGALLDRVLATTALLEVTEEVARIPNPPERLGALLRHELARLASDPRGTRLFFEYWALGVRQAAIRKKVAAALERYREAFRTVVEDILADAEANGSHVSAAGLAAVAVSLVNGSAVQVIMNPKDFDTGAYVAAVQNLITGITPRSP